MTTVDEYHSYARDCLRWAAKARTEEQREQLLSLAKDWTQAAEALDGYLSQGISTARIGTVRAVYGLGWLGLSRRPWGGNPSRPLTLRPQRRSRTPKGALAGCSLLR